MKELKELIPSEELCLSFCRKSCLWLLDLCAENGVFYISVGTGQLLKDEIRANVATSHIGVTIGDLVDINANTIPEEAPLRRRLDEARSHYLELQPTDVLPLETFGPLPDFSTAFLAEFLALDERCLSSPSYAIAIRRILYLTYSLLLSSPLYQDSLHPYLLFRLARAVVRLKWALVKKPDASPALIALFSDEQRLRSSLPHVDGVKLASILGFNDVNPTFNNKFLSNLNADSLDSLLQQIEWHALNGASTELAWHSTPRKDRADPAALLFSIATLSFLNKDKHDLLIAQSLRLMIDAFQPGAIAARNPFNIDDVGRALFVTTLESASALLSIILSRFHKLTVDEIDSVVHVTNALQSHIIEDVNEVHCLTSKGPAVRSGWCSDRAYSKMRIDSWVTVQGFAFLRRRLELLGLAKKKFVLSKYSWLPPSRCNPGWQELVDPNLGDAGASPILNNVETVVEHENAEHAPLFLLYGPPGTAKTTIAYGLAHKKNWDLITLSPSDFVVDSLDLIEQRSRELFSHMSNIDRSVILFDEMDTLLRDREKLGTTSAGMMIEFVVPALLPKLQEFRDYTRKHDLAAFFITNFYERLDGAVIRSGRIDNHLLVLPYTRAAQLEVCRNILRRHAGDNFDRISGVMDALKPILSGLPCNLTYRDLEWICSAISKGEDGLATIEQKRNVMGISPLSYKISRGVGAHQELYAFMKRYRGDLTGPQHVQVGRQHAIDYFVECGAELPAYKPFFGKWIELLSEAD